MVRPSRATASAQPAGSLRAVVRFEPSADAAVFEWNKPFCLEMQCHPDDGSFASWGSAVLD
jgi:hypothetical protein